MVCRRGEPALFTRYGSILMSQNPLQKSFWDMLIGTNAALILNMFQLRRLERHPYEVGMPDKLEPRSIKCIFIGYLKETMGYSFYYPPENKVLVARNAEFLENSLINQEASGSLEDLKIIQEEDTHPSMTLVKSLKEELKKTDMDGAVHTYKARLVAKGYTQTPYIDYEETLSPVADIRAIRILIAIAALPYTADCKRMQNVPMPGCGFSYGMLSGFLLHDAGYLNGCDYLSLRLGYVKFIYGLGVVPTIEKPINMYCDNTGAIAIANESGITKGARHFRAKVHYLREVIEFGDIKLEKVHTDDNLADPFTKALAFPKHSELTRNIGMLPASSFM
ncbi:retrotransposon protein, putative, ty1-copia subclass [Tanacetum coccineum]